MILYDLVIKFWDHTFASRWEGSCSGWTKELVIAHVIVDAFIWLAYMTIPIFLILIMRKRKDIPFNIFFFLFAVFIVGCGLTHLMTIITSFIPYYYMDFWVKLVTAIASIGTALVLWYFYSQIVELPSPFKVVELLEKSNKELEMANKELENFALVAAHDLQDPIKQNQVYLRLIQNGKTEFIQEMMNNNKRLNDFVGRLLEFARIGTSLKITNFSVQNIITVILQDLNLRIQEENAIIKVDDMPMIKCDGVQLGRVFQNLISNALKCKHPERQLIIEIKVKKSENFYEFSVIDNGIGIDSEHINNLFNFHKKTSSRIGFGLAICKKIIERHNGTIQAKSNFGLGSEFLFTISTNLEKKNK